MVRALLLNLTSVVIQLLAAQQYIDASAGWELFKEQNALGPHQIDGRIFFGWSPGLAAVFGHSIGGHRDCSR